MKEKRFLTRLACSSYFDVTDVFRTAREIMRARSLALPRFFQRICLTRFEAEAFLSPVVHAEPSSVTWFSVVTTADANFEWMIRYFFRLYSTRAASRHKRLGKIAWHENFFFLSIFFWSIVYFKIIFPLDKLSLLSWRRLNFKGLSYAYIQKFHLNMIFSCFRTIWTYFH